MKRWVGWSGLAASAAVVAVTLALLPSASKGGQQSFVTAAQFAALQARVTKLERFQRDCLAYRVTLTENSNGAMAWGIGLATPHAADFFAIPATVVVPAYCR